MMIRKFQEGNVYTLIVEGRIDMLNSAEFQKEAEEYGKQMAKDAWLGAAEDTASQIMQCSEFLGL